MNDLERTLLGGLLHDLNGCVFQLMGEPESAEQIAEDILQRLALLRALLDCQGDEVAEASLQQIWHAAARLFGLLPESRRTTLRLLPTVSPVSPVLVVPHDALAAMLRACQGLAHTTTHIDVTIAGGLRSASMRFQTADGVCSEVLTFPAAED